uniref:Small ubiquitin like modifier 2b n=1 Tax=Hucho hucho TaxID=62062 RepID=A0A4W5L3F2_9TELE
MVISRLPLAWDQTDHLLCINCISQATFASDRPRQVKTENNDHINLKVAGQDGSVVQFKIKRHTPLSKLMKAYCERQLEMEDEDTIDVFQQQTGGLY